MTVPSASPGAPTRRADVVVIGGALAGAATATLLRRARPDLEVLVVERSTAFTRRVGESTVEVSAYFLGRVLGLTRFLNESQLVKQGMRFWFTSPEVASIAESSELGNRFQTRLPAYQVDRSTLDEEVLAGAAAGGAEVWRGAAVREVELAPGGEQRVTIERGGETAVVACRWVIDASGHAAVLARRNGWYRENTAHPIAAAWARWRGVTDWDGRDLAQRFPGWAAATFTVRGTATNHLTGDGWWAWMIPLKGGDVSIGAVYDERLVTWPSEGTPGERLHRFLCAHPVGREIVGNAEPVERDVHHRRRLAYSSTVFSGDGFALVGDAAGFMDPLYSPGMDWLSYTVTAATEIVLAERRGEPVAERIARHNERFGRSYREWFEAIYRDKYEYLGEFDLMRIAFTFDVGLYFTGIVSRPMDDGPAALALPVFGSRATTPIARFMRTYNRRLAAIARERRRRGELGRHNRGERQMMNGFTHEPKSVRPLARAVARWARLELTEGWRTWLGPPRSPGGASTDSRSAGRDSLLSSEHGEGILSS
jgi:flavin-dependent dehydrogenase